MIDEQAQAVAEADGEQAQESSDDLSLIVEALLLAADEPLSIDRLQRLLSEDVDASRGDIRAAIDGLMQRLAATAGEVVEVAGGYRVQVRSDYAQWVSRLWRERPPKLTRALLETLALIVYRQPITRGEIEEIRGVSTSPNVIRTLFERGWIREVGVREVPGRPTLLGTTTGLLNDLGVKALDDLPSLPEIKDPDMLEAALTRLGAGRDAEQLKSAVEELSAEAAQAAQADDADANLDPDDALAEEGVDAEPAGAGDRVEESSGPHADADSGADDAEEDATSTEKPS